MRKKLLASLLSLAMLIGMISMPVASAADTGGTKSSGTVPDNSADGWFYRQLTEQGQDIYDAIKAMYDGGTMKTGKDSYDLVAEGVVDKSVVESYLNGNRTLFNDFAAAKDAFDLEHPEAWYFDSSELSFRVTSETNGTLHAYMGPGKSEDYYVMGVAGAADVASKSATLKGVIGDIVYEAGKRGSDYEKVRYVHDKITHGISYRFENECDEANIGYLRTAYALVTHQGVCEGYARSFQYALNELGIPCVLVHGFQMSGEPESHMWCAVYLTDSTVVGKTGAGAWYVVDATWDDPVGLDKDGNIKVSGVNGNDGGETETYLLVGQNVVGKNWQPSGFVSTSVTEFSYPDISVESYGHGLVEQNGLKVEYDHDAMEGGKSTVYHVSFNGDGLTKAAEKGYYFLVKMYDVNADGSVDEFDDWYYSVHGLHAVQSSFDPDNDFRNDANPYFGDTDDYLIYNIINCEYVEFAITTKAPPVWETAQDLLDIGGYYEGDYTDILAETGLIYNETADYEQPPHVKNVSPVLTTDIAAAVEHTIHIEFTDALYRPDQSSIDNAVAGKINDAPAAMAQSMGMDYRGETYAWGMNSGQPHTFADKPDPQNIRWVCETHGSHNGFSGIGSKCKLTTLEYEFTSSAMWADDSCRYEFYLTGLVGVKSNKFPKTWSYVFENKYPFWTCPLYSGYRWNLWGQPQALDNASDLDFDEMVLKGVDGKEQSLEELRAQMHLDPNDMNGRIIMSIQGIGENRSKSEELAQAISDSDDVNVPEDAILGSSLFEIDFARICHCIIVETGSTLRLCVGFPPGIDASMAGLVFKAYHFTRDIEGSCPYAGTPEAKDHTHTGQIISVEEIPITVTPLGLVITCSKFSPFEIVALDAEKAGIEADESVCLVLSSDGNGTVTDDADSNGMVLFESKGENGQHTFTLNPAEGYVLDTISLSNGKAVDVKDNQFTLSYADMGGATGMLDVTFVPQSIKQAELAAGESVEVPQVCLHEDKSGVDYAAPDCVEDGHTAGYICNSCGMLLGESVAIKALGHSPEIDAGTVVKAGCDTTGFSGDVYCTVCGDKLSDGETVAALGHTYRNGSCERCGAKEPVENPADDGPGQQPGGTGTGDQPSDPSGNPGTKPGDTGTPGSTVKPGQSGDKPADGGEKPGDVQQPSETVKPGDKPNDNQKPGGTTGTKPSKPVLPSKFTDVLKTAWYYDAFAAMYERGLIFGTSDTTMSPELKTTRAQVVTVLWRAAGAVNEGKNEFTDVVSGSYYEDAVNWAAKNGIVAGYGDGKFGPNDLMTREQMLAVMYRYAGYMKGDTNVRFGYKLSFMDTNEICDWAMSAVTWARYNGLVEGSGGYVSPHGDLTRAEMAAFILRFCNWIEA